MRSIHQALLWEMLFRGRWSVLGMFLAGNAIPLMVYGALAGFNVSLTETTLPFVVLQFSFLPLIVLQFAIGIAIAQSSMSRLFAWPISSNAIVAWHTLSGALVLAAETGIAASLYNWLFRTEWPIVGPMLFAGVVWSAIQLLQFIRVQPSLSGIFIWCSPLLLLIGWLSSRYGSFLSPPTHYWRETTIGDLLTLGIAAAICYGMALVGVRFERSGERLPQLGFSEWLTRRWESLTLGSSVRSNFRSAANAQLWYEFKLRGWALPLVSSIVTALVVIVITRGFVTGDWRTAEWRTAEWSKLHGIIPPLMVWASLFPLIWGAIFAIEDSSNPGEKREKSREDFFDPKTMESMGSFLAVLPFENRMFANVILWTIAKSTISLLLPILLVLLAIWFANLMPALLSVPGVGASWLPLVLITPWICMANAASFAFIAHRAARYLFVVVGVVCTLLLIARLQLAKDAFVQALSMAGSAASIVIVILTIWVFDRSRRAGQLTVRTQSLCLAIVLAIVAVAFVSRPTDAPVTAYPVLLAIAALAVLPFAALPLAIGASRHGVD